MQHNTVAAGRRNHSDPGPLGVAPLSDIELLRRVESLAAEERGHTVALIAHLAELERRKLHLAEGCGSLFGYCTRVLRLAEHAALNRIVAAHVSRRFPAVLGLLSEGALNLSTLRLLAPHLRPDTFESLVASARGRSKREVEVLVAGLAPRPDVPTSIRRLRSRSADAFRSGPPSSPSTGDVREPETGVPVFMAPDAGVSVGQPGHPASDTAADTAFGTRSDLPPDMMAVSAPAVSRSDSRSDSLLDVATGASGGSSASSVSSDQRTAPASSEGPDSQARRSEFCASRGRSLTSVTNATSLDRSRVEPLTPDRYRVQFTLGAGTLNKLRQAQDLLRREIPDGDIASIFERAVALLLEELARRKLGAATRPRPGGTVLASGSRSVPAQVRRAVWLRDGGRCAFVARSGRRCTERTFLEFHHREPYALGGEATVGNIALRCSAHNAYEAELDFGPWTGNGEPTQPAPPPVS